MKKIYSIIKRAKKYLVNNGIIAIPTETVYGLAGNAYSNKSVKKIFIVKKIFLTDLSEYAFPASPYTVSVGIAIISLLIKYFFAFFIIE